MIKIVKCVPNISNGKNPEIYNAVANSIKKIKGVKLLHVHPGFSANRTVITFVGTPTAVVDAAFELIKTAKELIDMTSQDGIHSRMGAADVCPLVPLSGVSMDECAQLARKLGKKVCPPCVNKLTSKLSSENQDHDLLRQKKYQDAKDGLITPSVALTGAISTMEIQYMKVIDDLMYSDSIKAHLIGNLSKYVVLDSLACDVCKCHVMIVHIMVNINKASLHIDLIKSILEL
jgi:hypothetical protein